MNCGTTEPHGFGACPAINEKCPKCDLKGHSEPVCSVVHMRAHKRQERTRKGSAGPRDQGKGREDPAVSKQERSESVVNAEQRRPRRPDRVNTPPRIKERVKETSSLEDSLTVVYDRKTPVVMTTQEYANQSHPTLPIRYLSDLGTASKQMAKWASEDPTRVPGIRESIAKWERFFGNLEQHPDDMKILNKDAQQQARWWKEFLSGGSGGFREVQRAVKHRK